MVSFSPGQRVWRSLAQHAELPESERPAFAIRVLTYRQWLDWDAAIVEEAASNPSPAEQAERRIELLDSIVVDWRNIFDGAGQPLSFDLQRLLDLLSIGDFSALISEVYAAQRLGPDDEKKSHSPSPSPPVESAKTAPG